MSAVTPLRSSLRWVRLLEAAADDLRALAQRSRPVLEEVLRIIILLDSGSIAATPLVDFARVGDLRDYGKLVVAVDGEPEHRIVLRQVGGVLEVVEVVEVAAVEDRIGDLASLLAGLRLLRLDGPVRGPDAQRPAASTRRPTEGG